MSVQLILTPAMNMLSVSMRLEVFLVPVHMALLEMVSSVKVRCQHF